MVRMKEIKPTKRQTEFHSTAADIAIYGGSAGGGKTFSLLLEPLRFAHVPGFDAVYFRRRRTDLTKSGSAWPESFKLYPDFGAQPNHTMLRWTFPSTATINFNGLARDSDVEHWATSQIPCLIFDQLEAFTAHQFFGLMERMRTMCGVSPYCRAGCNPSPDCFLHNNGTGHGTGLISWWVDNDGWAIKERSGQVRYFQRINEVLIYGDSPDQLRENINRANYESNKPEIKDDQFFPRSLTFILSTIYDNKPLLNSDPTYLATLHSLPYVRRMRMLGEDDKGGNWNIRETAGNVFQRAWFKPCADLPPAGTDDVMACRFWDIAASQTANETNDECAGARWHRKGDDYYWINQTAVRGTPGQIEAHIFTTAEMDGQHVTICIEGEPGSHSQLWCDTIKRKLTNRGYHCVIIPSRASKVNRAMPYSALAEQGHIFRPDTDEYEVYWLEKAILQHENFPPATSKGKDDIVDSCSGAVNYLRGSAGLLAFTGQDEYETRNAVEKAPRGTFRQEEHYDDGTMRADYHSHIDQDDDRLPWEKR